MDTGKGYVSLAMEMGVWTQGRGTLAWLWKWGYGHREGVR